MRKLYSACWSGVMPSFAFCREFYNFLTSDLHMTIASAELFDGAILQQIWSLIIRGDGTFLKATSQVGKKIFPFWVSIPAASVSWQTFLRKRWKRKLDEIYNNHYKVEERSVLQLHCDDKN